MSLDYNKVWETMNSLESVTSKICSARGILESALDALENHKYDKAETLMYAVDEYLQYYLEDFDRKFKDAWNETVVKINQENNDYFWADTSLGINNSISLGDCMNSSWEQFYYPEEYPNPIHYTESEMEAMCNHAEQQEKDKVIRWQLPVDKIENGDTGEEEYFIQFPDDLLESANLKEGDEVFWEDKNDGTFILRKVTKPLGMDEC
jgi:hypothetical protein